MKIGVAAAFAATCLIGQAHAGSLDRPLVDVLGPDPVIKVCSELYDKDGMDKAYLFGTRDNWLADCSAPFIVQDADAAAIWDRWTLAQRTAFFEKQHFVTAEPDDTKSSPYPSPREREVNLDWILVASCAIPNNSICP